MRGRRPQEVFEEAFVECIANHRWEFLDTRARPLAIAFLAKLIRSSSSASMCRPHLVARTPLWSRDDLSLSSVRSGSEKSFNLAFDSLSLPCPRRSRIPSAPCRSMSPAFCHILALLGVLLIFAVHVHLERAWKIDRWAFAHSEDLLVSVSDAAFSTTGQRTPPAVPADLKDGSIVHLTASASYVPVALTDPVFGVTVAARRLSREVSVCQWKEVKMDKESNGGRSLTEMCKGEGQGAAVCFLITAALEVGWWIIQSMTSEYTCEW